MKRRSFIKTTGVIGLGSTLPLQSCGTSLDSEIIILGGGMAGLNLAYLLDQVGKEYILLEGSSRLGGRLFTHSGIENREVGGRGIGDKYVEAMKIIEAHDIELVDITENLGGPTAIFKDGKLVNDWTSEEANPRMLEFRLPIKPPALTSLEEWYKRPDLDISYNTHLKNLGRTESEVDIININANYNDVAQTSAINSLHSAAFRKFNGSKRIFNFKNGSKSFVDAVSSRLKGNIMTSKMVTSISENKNCVTVICEDGSIYKSKKVVSTMPFTTLRDVQIEVPLNASQKELIANLPYTLITQIHLKPTKPFWEEDGYHVDMWTDTELERIMNTNAQSEAKDLVCWVNGTATKLFDDMSDSEIASFTLSKLKEIRPATEGKVEYIGTHKWGKYKFNKGAYAEFAIGQAKHFEAMIKPAGNLHFAGEHTAKASRGIEGAAASAVRVLNELV